MNILCKIFGHNWPGVGLLRATSMIALEKNIPVNVIAHCKRKNCMCVRNIKEEVRIELERDKKDEA